MVLVSKAEVALCIESLLSLSSVESFGVSGAASGTISDSGPASSTVLLSSSP